MTNEYVCAECKKPYSGTPKATLHFCGCTNPLMPRGTFVVAGQMDLAAERMAKALLAMHREVWFLDTPHWRDAIKAAQSYETCAGILRPPRPA